MGTRFELVLPSRGLTPPRSEGPSAAGRAFSLADLQSIGELVIAEIDDWHQRLSRFAPDSWVSHVNRTAGDAAVRCDEDVWALFADAHTVWRDSEGAFDITRGDGDALQLDAGARTIRFGRSGMSIDLGGIGKGHALDCCGRLLRAHGVTSAFLHGGTSSGLALGADPEGRPWRVALDAGAPAPLTDTAFAVSDAASQPRTHIVDPRAGSRPVDREARMAVLGPSARLCDAWSTALVVLGRVPARFPLGYVHAETAAR